MRKAFLALVLMLSACAAQEPPAKLEPAADWSGFWQDRRDARDAAAADRETWTEADWRRECFDKWRGWGRYMPRYCHEHFDDR